MELTIKLHNFGLTTKPITRRKWQQAKGRGCWRLDTVWCMEHIDATVGGPTRVTQPRATLPTVSAFGFKVTTVALRRKSFKDCKRRGC